MSVITLFDRSGVGFPPDFLGTADHRIEPVGDVEFVEHRAGEVLLAVGDEADGAVDSADEAFDVVVEVRRRRAGERVLDRVERLPELRWVDAVAAGGSARASRPYRTRGRSRPDR